MAVEKLLLGKIEVTYDTDPTPDNTNPIETMDLEVSRYEGDTVVRNVDRDIVGGKEMRNVNEHVSVGFSVAAAGSGTNDLPPSHGILWRACGFDETINASTSVVYQLPTATADLVACDSLTFYDFRDQVGKRQIITGVRGANSIVMNRGELPKFVFSSMLGTYNTPGNTAAPTVSDWSAWQEEVTFTNANVPVLTLDSESACTESLEINFGQAVSRRNLPGCQQTIVSNYEITGSMTIVAPAITDKNWFSVLESASSVTKVPLALTFGTAAGNTWAVAASEVQITNITEGESAEGDLTYSFDLSILDSPTVTFT